MIQPPQIATATNPLASARRPGAYAWYVAALLSAAHLVSFVDRFVMGLLAQPMRHTLGLTDTQLGLLQGVAFTLLYAVAGIPLGRLADVGRRRVLIACGMIVWSLATAACAFADNFWHMFGARLLVGVGEAALVPAAMSLLAAYFTRAHFGRAVAMFTTGASLGKTTALIGGAALLTLFAGHGLTIGTRHLLPWQGVFLIAALLGLVIAPLILTIVEPPRPPRAGVGGTRLSDALDYIRRHAAPYALHTTASCAAILLVQSFGAWAPSYFARARGYSVVEAGYVVGLITLVTGPLGGLSGGWAVDRLTRAGAREAALIVITAGLGVALPMVLLLVALPNGILPLIAFAFLMFSVSATAGPCLAGLQIITPLLHRGAATSVYMCVITLVSVGLGPLLVGVVSDRLAKSGGSLGIALAGVTSVVALLGIVAAIAGRGPVRRLAAMVEQQP
ncbi:MAG: MFS transporter [Janthinobacterium lividum]